MKLFSLVLFIGFLSTPSYSAPSAPLKRLEYKGYVFETDSPLFIEEKTQLVPSYYLEMLAADLEVLGQKSMTIQIITKGAPRILPSSARGLTDQEWLIRIIQPGQTLELPGFRAPLLLGGGDVAKDDWIRLVIGGMGFMISRVLGRFWEKPTDGDFSWLDHATVMYEATRVIDPYGKYAHHRKRIRALLDRVLSATKGCSALLEGHDKDRGMLFSFYLQALWNLQTITGKNWE